MALDGSVVNQDLEHLRLLKILTYVYAGITAVFSLIPLIHLGMGVAIVSGAIPMGPGPSGGGPGPEMMGWLFIAIGGGIIVLGESMAIACVFAARSLGEQRRRVFCMVIAGLECVNMPLGTILGVFTLIVLVRPSVKALFDANDRPFA